MPRSPHYVGPLTDRPGYYATSRGRAPIRPGEPWAAWRPASGHASGRYRVVRHIGEHNGVCLQALCTSRGTPRLYATWARASEMADKLNTTRSNDDDETP